MRVQLRQPEQRDERGVTAIVVALLAVVLLGIGAFSIDLGMAYASTRQLQTASDAAALAAADVFKQSSGVDCASVLGNGAVAAESAANSIRAENRPGSVRLGYSAVCDSGSIVVTYSSQGTTPRFFGSLLGRSEDYTTDRAAVAKVATLMAATGVRPYAVCASQIPPTAMSTGAVFKLSLPVSGNAVCPGAAASGNWWVVDCPETAGNNSNAQLATNTLNGCSTSIDVVPGQDTTPARTPSQLRNYLESYCTPRTNDTSSCLGANPGKINGNQVRDAWTTLADEQRRIILPAFCGGSPAGRCDTAAVVNAGGNNAVYPVESLVGIQVCGYRFGNQEYPAPNVSLGGECGANNPSGLGTHDTGNVSKLNYLLVRVVDVAALGSSGTSPCALGSACDHARVAYLTH